MYFILIVLLTGLLGLGGFTDKASAQACGASTPRYCVDSSGNIWANGLQARTGATGSFTFPFTTTAITLTNNTNQIAMGTTHVGTQTMGALTGNRTWTWPNVTGTVVTTGDTGSVTPTMLTGVIGFGNGGTGATAFVANSIPVSNGTSLNALAPGTANQVLRIPNAGGAPAYGAVDLTQSAAVSGALPTINGGTGQNSSAWAGIVLVSAGTWGQYAGTSCTNQFLRSLSASAVATCASVSLTTDVAGILGFGNGGTGATAFAANSIPISNGTAFGSIAAGTANMVLKIPGAGGAPAYNLLDAPNFTTQTANTVLVGPTTGVPATPTFRALVQGDLGAIVGTGQLKTASGSAVSGSGSAINVTMNDYSFMPSVTNTNGNGGINTVVSADPGDTVGRLNVSGVASGVTTVRWRYVTATDRPTIWVAYNPSTGALCAAWASDDPSPNSGIGVSSPGCASQVYGPSDLGSYPFLQTTLNAASAWITNMNYNQANLYYRAVTQLSGVGKEAAWILQHCTVNTGSKALVCA